VEPTEDFLAREEKKGRLKYLSTFFTILSSVSIPALTLVIGLGDCDLMMGTPNFWNFFGIS
jgi:hypothetical protein